MRRGIAILFILAACRSPSSPPARDAGRDAQESFRTVPISDLHFKDYELEEIAASLGRKAHQQGIDRSSGRNRVECLISLEASLGDSTRALERVNSLVFQITANDVGRWAKLRQRAERELSGDDERSIRVRELLKRWQFEKSEAAWSHLSSNYTFFISSAEWERKFYEFVSARPADAVTWAWLILRYDASSVKQQYGNADSEAAYRFYLEFTQFGDAREAREVFSVPGIQISEASITHESGLPPGAGRSR